MLKSLFFGYLSPAWKRLVRTIAVLNYLFWFLVAFDEFYLAFYVVIFIVVNALLSYIFELFVKKNQKNELWVSLLIIAINIYLSLLFFYAEVY